MSDASKKTKYSDFMKMTVEERLAQSSFFKKKKPDMVPTIIFSRNAQLP
jgi:hypothetical protein